MLYKLLWRKQPLWQLIGAGLGVLVGTTLLMLSLQVHHSVKLMLGNEDKVFPSRFLTLSKKVSILSNLPGMRSSFSQNEIEQIKKQVGVIDATPFQTAGFKSLAVMEIAGFPSYHTELFLESVPSGFLGSLPSSWNWKKGTKHVPILLPNSFLHLYNFGFAPANGYPMVSKGMINKVSFTLHLQNKEGKTLTLPARIVAFSDRITTILVPQNFMQWASLELQDSGESLPTYRVLLKTQTPIPEAFRKFLERKKYDANQELLKETKVAQLANIALGTSGIVGLILLLMAFLAFWLSFQVLVQRNAQNLRVLLHIGFPPRVLTQHYLLSFLSIGIVVFILATIAANLSAHQLSTFALKSGIELETKLTAQVIAWSALPVVGLLIIQSNSMRCTIEKLARS